MTLDINNYRCHNAALCNPNSILTAELEIAMKAKAPTRMFLIQVLPRHHLAKPIPSEIAETVAQIRNCLKWDATLYCQDCQNLN